MSDDPQTYQRAASAALIGLFTQIVLTVVVALLGLYAHSSALHAAAFHLLGGVAIWIILWMLFHQHRQERAEALEADRVADTDAATAAMFDEAGDQLHVARKRLGFLIRFWLNVVSLFMAFYLLVIGGISLWQGYTAAQNESLAARAIGSDANLAVLAVVALAVGFIAFLVARYVAGMTQVKAWQPLRGGAGYLMGVAVVSMLIVAASAYSYLAASNDGFAIIAIVIPAMMVLLGIEIILAFVFGMYRPRKPDEVPQPAFDSRILGWLTRPESIGKIIGDTINYQFGFEISASWFYRLLSRALTPLVALGGIVLLAFSSVVIVGSHQNAIITQFGAYERVIGPGLHWKYPWPINRAEKYDVYQIHTMDIASSDTEEMQRGDAILWTNLHGGEEKFFVTAESINRNDATDRDAEAGGEQVATIAAGLIGARVTIQYRIDDLERYVQSASKPDELFRRRAEHAVSRYFATHNIDELLSTARLKASSVLRTQLQQQGDDLGLDVLFAAITALHPPQEKVAEAFLEQINAGIEKQTKIEEAEKDAITTLTQVAGSRERALEIDQAITRYEQLLSKMNALRGTDPAAAAKLEQSLGEQDAQIEKLMDAAGGQAVILIYQARAARWQYALAERSRAMRTRSKYLAYKQAPQYYRMREYFNVLAEGLADRRKIVLTTPDADAATIRLNLEDQTANLGSTFDNE